MRGLEELARARNTAHKKVVEWMHSEAHAGNLRQNSEAPGWSEYERAEREFQEVVNAVGVNTT